MFQTVFERVIGHEGQFTKNPKDPGNWTAGELKVLNIMEAIT